VVEPRRYFAFAQNREGGFDGTIRKVRLVMRLSARALGIYEGEIFIGTAVAGLLIGLPAGSNINVALIATGALWVLLSLPIPFMRLELTPRGAVVRNCLGRREVPWDQVTEVGVYPNESLSLDNTAWLLHITLRDGQCIPVRATAHITKRRSRQLTDALKTLSSNFKFVVANDIDALAPNYKLDITADSAAAWTRPSAGRKKDAP
jgi:hypothetical protein